LFSFLLCFPIIFFQKTSLSCPLVPPLSPVPFFLFEEETFFPQTARFLLFFPCKMLKPCPLGFPPFPSYTEFVCVSLRGDQLDLPTALSRRNIICGCSTFLFGLFLFFFPFRATRTSGSFYLRAFFGTLRQMGFPSLVS